MKGKKGIPLIPATKDAKKREIPGETGAAGIPLIKFEEEGRKPVSLSYSFSTELSRSISQEGIPKNTLSSATPPAREQSRPWRDPGPAPEHEGRTNLIPPSYPTPMKIDRDVNPEEAVKQVASPPRLPGPPEKSEKPIETGLFGSKQEKTGEPDQPIEITSDRVETFSSNHLIVFKGNVVARQKDMVIYADSVDAVIIGDGRGIEKVVASGNVKIQQGLRTANCQRAVFHNTDKKLVLTGDPKVWEGEQMISGDEIVFDIDQNRLEVRGGSSGRGKAMVYPKRESPSSPFGNKGR
jgi:lipopolysaccharide export system protein LptA